VSKYSLETVLAKLRESKATVYAIGLLEENDPRGGLFGGSPSKKAKEVLERFAATTGGRAYFPKSVDERDITHRRHSQGVACHVQIAQIAETKELAYKNDQ
jgi:hypothetical protein